MMVAPLGSARTEATSGVELCLEIRLIDILDTSTVPLSWSIDMKLFVSEYDDTLL